jgi:hypothetical protein
MCRKTGVLYLVVYVTALHVCLNDLNGGPNEPHGTRRAMARRYSIVGIMYPRDKRPKRTP